MKKVKQWILSTDQTAIIKSKSDKGFRIIAKKGDKVSIISDHGNVVIVDNGKEKFSILKTEVANV